MRASLVNWFDSFHASGHGAAPQRERGIDWLRIVPFLALHLGCIAVVWVGFSPVAGIVAVISYLLRMFAITGFYHRYFAHRAFTTSRAMQFLFALLGAAATQRGPLWWAAHHRNHHRFADTVDDPHSPGDGFLWSHMGWFLSVTHFHVDRTRVRDWLRYPELVWLDRFDLVVPVLYASLLYALGWGLEIWVPELGTNGWQMLVWGYVVSTVALLHATLLVNSLAHRMGGRRFATQDESRNNFLVALLTLGEGWHNNHHRYAGSARQGFYWWQVDVSYYLLRALASVGLIANLRSVPEAVLLEGRR